MGTKNTVLQGLTDSSGAPQGDGPAPTVNYYNRGVRIGPANGLLSNITIKDLKFSSFRVAVDIIPHISSSSNRCDSYTTTSGTGSNIVVENSTFDNNWVPIEVAGASNNVQINGNSFTNSSRNDIVLWGQKPPYYCIAVDPNAPLPDVGAPAYASIIGNTNNNNQFFIAIDLIAVDNVLVANNTLSEGNFGEIFYMSGVTNSLIIGNTLDGGGTTGLAAGFFVSDKVFSTTQPNLTSKNVLIANNQINNTLPGVIIDSSTQGYSMVGNSFTGTLRGYPPYGVPDEGDILLCDNGSALTNTCSGNGGGASFNNNVIATSCTQVMNLGIKNTLFGLLSVSTDINNPPAGYCKLKY
jgi:hypothetical protein